jgi:hypothetical protein
MNSSAGAADQTFTIRVGGSDQTIIAGAGKWVKGELKTAAETDAIAASGAWTADHIYTLKIVRYRTPFNTTYTLRFAGDELLLDSEQNAAFGERRSPQLIGKAAN